MGFCPKCGSLMLGPECKGCGRAAEPSLEKRMQETFENDDHSKGMLRKAKIDIQLAPALYQLATKDSNYVQGALFYKGLNTGKLAIAHPYALAFLRFDKNSGIDVPANLILSAKHNDPLETYQIMLRGENNLKVQHARQLAISNPKVIEAFYKDKPFAKYVLVPDDFDLQ